MKKGYVDLKNFAEISMYFVMWVIYERERPSAHAIKKIAKKGFGNYNFKVGIRNLNI